MSEKYQNAEERIASFQKFGWKLGLDRMRALCGSLGNPQDSLRIIHVAGTNGKGSVCRYLYETLLAHGYSVGIFTSPGLGDFRSRIESNGEWISASDLERCTDIVLDKVESDTEDTPTEFEVLTAIALVYFASKQLDFTILEVGLGGTLDSTNIIDKPAVSVVTEIGFDHIEQLGDTIEKIASEKAGIIKAGCPVICGTSDSRAAETIARKAYDVGAPLIDSTNRKIPVRTYRQKVAGSLFSCDIRGTRYTNIEISMPGGHQVENAVTALATFDELRRRKLVTSDGDALRRGMKSACLPGRFEVHTIGSHDTHGEKLLIFDGAHNPAGAAALADAVTKLLPNKRIAVLSSMLRDKQTDDILKEVARFASFAIFTETSNTRSMGAEELSCKWNILVKEAVATPNEPTMVSCAVLRFQGADSGLSEAVPDLRKAYARSMDLLLNGRQTSACDIMRFDALVVCGSLYLISDLMAVRADDSGAQVSDFPAAQTNGDKNKTTH